MNTIPTLVHSLDGQCIVLELDGWLYRGILLCGLVHFGDRLTGYPRRGTCEFFNMDCFDLVQVLVTSVERRDD